MTLRSVAEKAGVAVDTARKVLRGDPTVRPYIRQRVQRVIRQTGYRPNLVARALRQSHLDLVPLSVSWRARCARATSISSRSA